MERKKKVNFTLKVSCIVRHEFSFKNALQLKVKVIYKLRLQIVQSHRVWIGFFFLDASTKNWTRRQLIWSVKLKRLG